MSSGRVVELDTNNSFASNGECGLKLGIGQGNAEQGSNSFASNGECGLKRCRVDQLLRQHGIHSPAMANVD